jgi:hypothetical protein
VDNERNLFVVWRDFRNGEDDDIYAQKVTPSGSRMWPDSGKALCVASGVQKEHVVMSEWDSGLYALWTDGRPYHDDVYAAHLNQAGQLTDPYWLPDSGGVVVDFFQAQRNATVTHDGEAGMMAAFEDLRASGKAELWNVWAQRVNDWTVSVKELPNAALPNQHELAQNSPNPFNPTTQIRFSIPQTELVKVTVFNMLGQETATLINEVMNAGSYVLEFEAQGLSSGTYFYRLNTPSFQMVRKMVLLR